MLPISDRGTMISATVNMNLSVSSFNSISFWFMYFEALLLGKYPLKLLGFLESWTFSPDHLFLSSNTSHFEVYYVK